MDFPPKKAKIFEELERIAPFLPAPIYWYDKNNVVLGANDLEVKVLGLNSINDLVGKTLYDLYPKEMAGNILNFNNEVMRIGKESAKEEVLMDIATGETRYFLSTKKPLYDDDGNVIGIIGTSIETTEEKKEAERQKKNSVFEYLEKIVQNLPVPAYWFDENNVVLGGNRHIAKAVGGTNINEFIGKKPHDYYGKGIANDIVKNLEEVRQTGKIISREEIIKDLTTGEKKYFSAFLAPLYGHYNSIIGVIGISIDITAQKEAERLLVETERQKTIIDEHEKFRKIINQMVHDIRTPIAALKMTAEILKTQMPEQARVTFREISNSMESIANSVLSLYTKREADRKADEIQPVIVSLLLDQVLMDKRAQYKDLAVTFNADFLPGSTFAFIAAAPSSFKRMLSNIINNSVDALEGWEGKVDLKLTAENEQVKVTIKDNGKGMPKEVVEKILNDIEVTSGKEDGYGIGMTQVRDTLKNANGQMTIDSKIGKGTKIVLTFPKIASAPWLAEEIILHRGDIILVLDDDPSIHCAWDMRFKKHLSKISLHHFASGQETLNFIDNTPNKNKVFLLADFELLKQELNGLQIIELSGIKRSILVTSHHFNYKIRDLAAKSGTKILPKQFAAEVPIFINKSEGVEENLQKNEELKVDAIIVDDSEDYVDSLAAYLGCDDKIIDVYYRPEKLLENLSRYPKDIHIFMDHDFRVKMDGFELAKRLRQEGFTKLYMLSGRDRLDFAFNGIEIPSYLKLIEKIDTDKVKAIIEEGDYA